MNESIIDIIESNKKTLRAEYQKGYIIVFKEGEKRAISEFLKDLKAIDREEEIYFMPDLIKKWVGKLKE